MGKGKIITLALLALVLVIIVIVIVLQSIGVPTPTSVATTLMPLPVTTAPPTAPPSAPSTTPSATPLNGAAATPTPSAGFVGADAIKAAVLVGMTTSGPGQMIYSYTGVDAPGNDIIALSIAQLSSRTLAYLAKQYPNMVGWVADGQTLWVKSALTSFVSAPSNKYVACSRPLDIPFAKQMRSISVDIGSFDLGKFDGDKLV